MREFAPARIWQWGSLLHRRHFSLRSDIDVGVEGLGRAERLFELHARAEALTAFPLHILELERIEPEYACLIRISAGWCMASPDRIAALAAELDAALPVLDRIDSFYDRFQRQRAGADRTVEDAIVVSDVMVSFYTCLETAFLRISQFFENALDDTRWHEHLLRAMTWTVPEMCERVISDATVAALSELLRFRHFKRCYFSSDYDWDRLELVRSKYLAYRDPVRGELVAYSAYLQRIARDARKSEPQ